jgi:hypothetical protein
VRTAHVAVETAAGPHVTPQAFAVALGRVWLVAPRDSLKVRALRRRPAVGVLFIDGDESVSVTGTAEIVSPFDARRVASMAPALSCASSDYATRNAPLMAGFAADMFKMSAPLPLDRVVIAVTPERTERLSESAARVDVEIGTLPAGSALDPLDDLVTAALAVSTPDGPIVLPARWDGSRRVASVAAASLEPAAACLSLDRSKGVRPSRFRGALLRGHLAHQSDHLLLRVERTTLWNGFSASTVRAA